MTGVFSWQNSIGTYHQTKHPTHIHSLEFCYYYSLSKEGKREAQKEQVTCRRSQNWWMVRLGFEPRSSPSVEKAMEPHSSTLAWRIPGVGEPDGLPPMGSHKFRHYWSNLTAAAAASLWDTVFLFVMLCSLSFCKSCHIPLIQVQFLPSRSERIYIPLFFALHRLLWILQTIVVSKGKWSGVVFVRIPWCHHYIPAPPDTRWYARAHCLWESHRGAPLKPQVEQRSVLGDHTSIYEGHVLRDQTTAPTNLQ